MSTTQKMYYCQHCQRQTVHLKENPARAIHFLLGLFTLGLWWLVWLFAEGLGGGKAQCTQCGTVYDSQGVAVDCKECGESVPPGHEVCPHCGVEDSRSWP